MSTGGICDLDLLVKDWALTSWVKSGNRGPKKPTVEIVWNHVTFTSGETQWRQDVSVPQPANRSVYSSVFRNRTDVDAENTLKAERTSTARCRTQVDKGYSTHLDLGLGLSLPHGVGTATLGFSRGVTINKAAEETREEVQTWAMDTRVPCPAGMMTRATVQLKEKRWRGRFTLPVMMKGRIVVNLYDPSNPIMLLGTLEQTVQDLLPRFGGQKQGQSVLWDLNGTCDFEFGVEQMVDIEHFHLGYDEDE